MVRALTVLAGYWAFGDPRSVRRGCERLLDGQAIHGAAPRLCEADAALAMGRRLHPLLPEDRHDLGPVRGGDGSVVIADLRLDNRDELLADLSIPSAQARSMPDAAVLARALERWDEACLDRIVGDFAFAWWHAGSRRLRLARDYLGSRPLHFHRGADFFAFASMPKGLHALPEIPRKPDRETAAEFLALIPHAPDASFFEGIHSVPAGAVVEVTADRLTTRQHWRPDLTPLRLKDGREYEEALREQLDRAVAARLRGMGEEIGSHLSAGLDSSAVTATAARLLEGRGRVIAYTSVPREGYDAPPPPRVIADEGPLAAQVAARFANVEHVLVRGERRSPLDALDRNFFLFDRPVLNLCNLTWSDAINEDARSRRLSIMLSGQLGNMSFSHDGMALLPRLLRQGRLLALSRHALGLVRNGSRVGTVGAQILGPYLPRPIWQAVRRLRGRSAALSDQSCIRPDIVDALRLDARAAERSLDFSHRPRADGLAARLWALRRTDLGNYNKGILAGWGIDLRDPSSDRRLMEFCLGVPEEQYLAGGIPRSLARRAFADRLPGAVLAQRRKGYQAVDWHEGLAAGRGALTEEIERLAALPDDAALLDTARMAKLVEDWPESGWETPQVVGRYRLGLLRGVSLGHFLRRATGSNR